MNTNQSFSPKASEILAALSANKKSGWSERARQRQTDRAWLRRSRRIALHVLNALEAKGMNQKQLAEAVGVTPQYISKVVSGKEGENLSLKTITKLEEALSICLIEVCDYSHTTLMSLPKTKTVGRATANSVSFHGQIVYNHSRAQSTTSVQGRSSFYPVIPQC